MPSNKGYYTVFFTSFPKEKQQFSIIKENFVLSFCFKMLITLWCYQSWGAFC